MEGISIKLNQGHDLQYNHEPELGSPFQIETTQNRFGNLSPATLLKIEQNTVIDLALEVLAERCLKGEAIKSAKAAAQYVQLQLAEEKEEIFSLMYLNTKNQIIKFEHLFRGSVKEAAVYPRVIARRVLELNATAVIAFHNHPSGCLDPS